MSSRKIRKSALALLTVAGGLAAALPAFITPAAAQSAKAVSDQFIKNPKTAKAATDPCVKNPKTAKAGSDPCAKNLKTVKAIADPCTKNPKTAK